MADWQALARAGGEILLDLWFIPQAVWLFLPAYTANMAPVFAMKLFPRWNTRIDGGRTWRDGKPLLGAGKTWRGFFAACLVGTLTALLLSFRPASWPFSDFARTLTGGLHAPILLGLGFGLGAILGDSVKSFFKRRTGREGGAPWIPFDQLDFVVGGLLFAYLASLLLQILPPQPPNWCWLVFGRDHWPRLLVILLLTPLLHFAVNFIGYKLKMKKVPW